MSGRVLLDTNIAIAIFAQDAAVQRQLAAATEVFVPVVVLGELYYGAYKSRRVSENLLKIAEFAATSTILVSDTKTSREYGEIKSTCGRRGV